MSAVVPFAVAGGVLFAIGLYGMIGRTGLIHRLLGANIMASAIFLFLVVLSTRAVEGAADPVPQAMVLTGIVISVSLTAFALGLIRYLPAMTDEDGPRRSTRESEGPSADD